MTALLALGLCVFAAVELARRWLPDGDRADRLCATAVLVPALGVVVARLLGGLGAIHQASVLGAFAGLALLAWWIRDRRPSSRHAEPPAFEPALALPLAAGAFALAVVLVAARRLPIWQWDSLGYHLPFVGFAMQASSLAGVPWQLPYLGSYPHVVELWDLAARVLLPDDRWLDAAQLPLCLGGAVAVAGLARRAGAAFRSEIGAAAGLAVAAGALWLCLPAVFLQLPSVYVDVASASFFLLAVYWLLAPPSLVSATLFGIALGLFLGSKPAAPPAALLLGLGFAVRALRAPRIGLGIGLVLLSAALALALGAESYVTNLLAWGNPLWPIQLNLGLWHAPGIVTPAQVLTSGAAAPHLTGALLSRLLHSWTALHPQPAFDMRIGGFGPLFLFFAMPLGLWGALRRRGLWLLALVAALATPDPAVARYTLPFPALLLALGCAELSRLPRAARSSLLVAASALAFLGLGLAWPGLAGGHPLWEALAWDRTKQEAELLPSETADQWAALRAKLSADSAAAVDRSFDLPYLLWRPDMANRVEVLPAGLDDRALVGWLQSRRIVLLTTRQADLGARLHETYPGLLTPLFRCGASEPDCEVYAVRSQD